MNPDVFFKNFELLADAPNGVQKLRELILQLAVMGKLVPQDPNDEPASVLREKIKERKEKLAKEGKINEIKVSRPLDTAEIVYELPQGWEWCRWNDVSMQIGDLDHKMPLECDDRIPYVSPKDFYDKNEINFTTAKKISREDFEKLRQKIQPEKNDIIFPRYGTIGENRFVVTENEFLASYSCAIIKNMNEIMEPKYSYYYSLSPLVKSEIIRYINKTTQPNVGLKSIQMFVYPLPPLAEQKRIVTKVDELMALCDKLEARRQKKQELQRKLNSAALDGMLSAENQEEFEQNWQRICENFDLLYDNPENVGKLRQAILQLAVQGKLVEQDSKDEPASVLIEKIKLTKEKLVKEGKSQKTKSFPEISIDELPYEIPESWKWIRLDEIIIDLKYGTSKKCAYDMLGTPVLRIPNIVNGKIDTDDLKFTNLTKKEKDGLKLESGDLLLVRSNGSTSLVGRSALINGELDGYAYAGYLVRLRTFSTDLFSDYLHLVLNIRYVRDQIEMPIRTTSGVKNINSTEISRLIVPLPPLAEQKRIVEKVEQLVGLCDELESKLRKEREDSEKLMEAVVKGLLESAVAGKTELDRRSPMQAAVIQLK